jgi:hypothetical protein
MTGPSLGRYLDPSLRATGEVVVTPDWTQAAIQSALNARGRRVRIGAGAYALSGDLTYTRTGAATDEGGVTVDTKALFTGGKLNLVGLFEGRGPWVSHDAESINYDSRYSSHYQAYFWNRQVSLAAGGPPRVAVGHTNVQVKTKGNGWGWITSAFAEAAGAIAFPLLVTVAVQHVEAKGYGVRLKLAGQNRVEAGFQVAGRNPGAALGSFLTVSDSSGYALVTGSLFNVPNANGVKYGLNWRGAFGINEIDIPGLQVSASNLQGHRPNISQTGTDIGFGPVAFRQRIDAPDIVITGITNANPAVITAVAHGLSTGALVYATQIRGMADEGGSEDDLNGESYTITRVDADHVSLDLIDTTNWSAYVSGGVLRAQKKITNVTQANPCEVTIAGHGWSTGNNVSISALVGMNEVTGANYQITVTGANTFTLDGVNSTSYTPYVSGGVAHLNTTPSSNVRMRHYSIGTSDWDVFCNGFNGSRVFQVVRTASATEYVAVQGATDGKPMIKALASSGGAANRSLIVRGGGTGGVDLQDGASASKIEVNTTGIGFFGVTPVARSTGWAAIAGTASKSAISNTSTATAEQCAQMIKAIRDHLVLRGDFAT